MGLVEFIKNLYNLFFVSSGAGMDLFLLIIIIAMIKSGIKKENKKR